MTIRIEHPSKYRSLKLKLDVGRYVLKYEATYNNFLNLLRQYNKRINPTFFISPELLTIDEIVTIVIKTHQSRGLNPLNVLKRTSNEFTTYDINQLQGLKYVDLGCNLLEQLSYVQDMKQILECYVHEPVCPKKLYKNDVVHKLNALRKLLDLESVSLQALNDQISSKLVASTKQFKNQRIYLYKNTFVNQWGFWVNPKINPILFTVYRTLNDNEDLPDSLNYDFPDTICCIPVHELSKLSDVEHINWVSILLSDEL